ncbi:MAG: HypC/HybG/HupF family hydrogenase formation chaperone [Actinomycetota bacterium]|nr:HypC/HybG/HupF family hydrogenase formation chaperone [Actinomycetota bacterium]
MSAEVLTMDALAPSCEHQEGCITCSDEALPMRVERIDHDRELALCSAEDGAKSTVEIALVLPVAEGDTLLVHAGTAIAHAGAEESSSDGSVAVEERA